MTRTLWAYSWCLHRIHRHRDGQVMLTRGLGLPQTEIARLLDNIGGAYAGNNLT